MLTNPNQTLRCPIQVKRLAGTKKRSKNFNEIVEGVITRRTSYLNTCYIFIIAFHTFIAKSLKNISKKTTTANKQKLKLNSWCKL